MPIWNFSVCSLGAEGLLIGTKDFFALSLSLSLSLLSKRLPYFSFSFSACRGGYVEGGLVAWVIFPICSFILRGGGGWECIKPRRGNDLLLLSWTELTSHIIIGCSFEGEAGNTWAQFVY